MKNTTIKLLFILIGIIITYNTIFALTPLPMPDPGQVGGVSPVVGVSQGQTYRSIQEIIIDKIIEDFLFYIVGAIAVAMIIYSGVNYVLAAHDEGEAKKSIKNIVYAVSGLVIIILAKYIVGAFTGGDVKGQIDTDINQSQSDYLVQYIFIKLFDFIKYIVGAVAVAMIVYSGYNYIASAVNEGEAKKSIKNIVYAVSGLIIIILADYIVGSFYGGDTYTNNYGSGLSDKDALSSGDISGNLILNVFSVILEFVKYIVGAIAVAYIVYTGIQMIIAQDSAKAQGKWKDIIYVVAGFAVIILASELVNIFMGGDYTSNKLDDQLTKSQATDISNQVIKVVIDFVRYLIGTLAIIFFTIEAVILVITTKEDEKKKAINIIINAITAFLIVIVSEQFVKIFYSPGGAFGEAPMDSVSDVDIVKFNLQVINIINVVERLIAVIAIIIIIFLGGRMVVSPSEDQRKKSITGIGVAVIGLIFVIISSTIVAAFYGTVSSSGDVNLGPNIDMAINEIIGIVNYALAFLGLICVVMIVYGGFLYITAGVNENNKKKALSIIINFVIGIVIIISAYTIVRMIVGQ